MFQRRTSSSLSASVASAYAKQAHGHSMRRRVKRRSYYSSGFWGDSRTLLMLVVLVTVLLAVFVWLGVQVYSALYYYHGSVGDSRYSHHRHPHLGRTVYDPREEEEDEDDDWEVMPYNHIYRIPEAMDIMGDRSDEYARLRKEVDGVLPPDSERSLQRVKDLTKKYARIGTMPQGPHHSDSVREPYDIYNCPDTPPEGYPFEWKLVDEVLAHWPVTEIENVPSKVHQGLCIFDYQKDYDKALRYRQAELPFVVVNNPDVARTAERWSIPGYLSEMTGKTTKHRAEYNTNGHFLYNMPTKKDRLRKQHRRPKPLYDDKEEETEQLRDSQGRLAVSQRTDIKPQALRMTFDDWLEKANKTQVVGMEDEHYYFRLIGCGYMDPTGGCDHGSSEYLYDELPYFQPHNDNRNELYLGNPREQKGIHCRFGMKGVIAENHFDAGRNSIALLGGRRRYILSHPRQCPNLALFPRGHESARHSEVDYANPDVERYPEFAHDALANEVVLEAGQTLYLPTFWFHYIVSLEINYQCNTRSGNTDHYNSFIHECGFPAGKMIK